MLAEFVFECLLWVAEALLECLVEGAFGLLFPERSRNRDGS